MTDTATPSAAPAEPHVEVFSFGEPEPVLDQREILGYFESAWNGSYYEPPLSFDGLVRALKANPHHESAVGLKVQMLASLYRPSPLLSRAAMTRILQDRIVLGNAWIERVDSVLGRPMALKPTLGRFTRVRRDGRVLMLIDGREHDLAGEVLHLQQPDLSQEIYGRPSYEACLQSALLNEAATLFRRKYYVNGSHAGFILYMTDAAQDQTDIDAMRKALKESKGPGNFRNVFMYAPQGKADGLKVIPIAEVTAKDEFLHMKTVTRDDVLAAHRVPPHLLGIVPQNAGGFGDVSKAAPVFWYLELRPLAMEIESAINTWMGDEVVGFDAFGILN
ncbi:phage portal protein [Roseospira marina]|uniref:Phage portal protein n=1 Tax=Roseospira marina TaxID=140057 RepID=A0A5M6I6B7_9PROT|nr:phage portal protein [Roseospira marina]KAA5603791.1 phage portal protein [Roseospira marina]MBB4316081.1 PBSX family phage portal protein [Roseospira marina]MBB5089247.1 PBSX family phage portal protein [Roseospira marina]